MMEHSRTVAAIVVVLSCIAPGIVAQTTSTRTSSLAVLAIDLKQQGKPISTNLFGVFFEDINYGADGGLYAELIQNRSFEYKPTARVDWTALTGWEIVRREGSDGSIAIYDSFPIHPNNPHYIVLETRQPGKGFGLSNRGFDGIAVEAGKTYDFSMWGRQLFTGNRWGNSGRLEEPARFIVQLESRTGEILASNTVTIAGRDWHKATTTLIPSKTDAQATLVLLSLTRGGVALDEISLFPRHTFKGRPNGLRADLAQAIADLKPRFIRFPGGCLVHGYGLNNMYRWPNTVGPVEQRKSQPNLWGYYQSMGLGYFEYFQFCEDIGAMPIPVVPAGVCCQNADHQGGTGQRGLPMDEMPAYVQEVLDLIEWANGPADSKWGSVRAAAGHPAPFGLKYLAIGNEEHITPVFRERFKMIYEAVRQKHPEITIIGTVGPFHSGPDYDNGWQFADELKIPVVDEHYYVSPRWFWDNLQRYDKYDRNRSKVYLGEYAAHDVGRRNTLRSALAEAAYLTSLERNGDVVIMASYAPLLGKRGRTQWNPNLIYFSNTQILRTINYYVQQLFSLNAGDTYIPSVLKLTQHSATPGAEARPEFIFLGTWNTEAEFDDVQLVPEGQQPWSEDFSRAPTNWKALSGNWSVANEVLKQTADDTPAIYLCQIPLPSTNYTLSVRARKTGGAEGFLIGFKYRDEDNYFWWNLGGWGNSRHAIEKCVDGSKQEVGRDRRGSIEINRWYNVRVEVTGPRVRCYLDGQLVHEIDEANFVPPEFFAHSVVRDATSGDVIIKLVNGNGYARTLHIQLAGLPKPCTAKVITLSHSDPTVVNEFEYPDRVKPVESTLNVSSDFTYTVAPYSLTVIRIPTR